MLSKRSRKRSFTLVSSSFRLYSRTTTPFPFSAFLNADTIIFSPSISKKTHAFIQFCGVIFGWIPEQQKEFHWPLFRALFKVPSGLMGCNGKAEAVIASLVVIISFAMATPAGGQQYGLKYGIGKSFVCRIHVV